jgi:hypothetical protein
MEYMTTKSQTLTPRVFATRRICFNQPEYEKIANLIKKYGCVVSKVSDLNGGEYGILTIVYFDIPLNTKEEFLAEEKA